MDLILKRNIKSLLKKYQIRPSKRLGQNFLIDKGVIKKIIGAADLESKDIVLEIGPGLSVLTQELAKKAKEVIAVEKDPKMCQILNDLLDYWKIRNVKIVNKDILKISPEAYNLKPKTYKVVGNLPFYLTAPVIRQFLENMEVQPQYMVLVVQKEVGQRICARPGKMSILAVSVQIYAQPEIISYISKKSFWPQPKVDSAIIKISKNKEQRIRVDKDLFFKIVKAGFSQPRKQIINNLAKKLKLDKEWTKFWLLENSIQPSQRAETLNIKDWIKLTKTLPKS